MNKHQIVWLIIRLIGVYFAYLTLVSLFGLIGAVPALFTLPKIDTNNKNANVSTPMNPTVRVQPVPPGGSLDTADQSAGGDFTKNDSITEKFRGENVKDFAWFLVLTILYGAGAWYLLKDGRILFEALSREEPDGLRTEKTAEVTALNLSDKEG